MIEGYKGDTTDNQEVFDFIWNFITKQASKSTTASGSCLYRSDNGSLCCAAGCLISDKDYDPKMEGYGVTNRSIASLYFISRYYDINLLDKCQAAHDNVDTNDINLDFVQSFQNNMKEVAKNFNLKVPQ